MAEMVKRTTFLGNFEKLWRGQHSLRDAFFGFFLLVGLLLAPILGFLFAFPFVYLGQGDAARAMFFIALVVYPFFAGVGVWRSANAYLLYGKSAYAVRVLNVLGAKLVVVIVLCGIVMRVTGVTFLGLMRLMH